MRTIKIIPAIGIIKKLKGMGILNFAFFVITHFMLLFPLIIIPLLLFNVIEIDKFLNAEFIISIIFDMAILYLGIKYFYIPGNYIPNKSFFLERLTKEKINTISLVGLSLTIIGLIVSYIWKGHFYYQYILVFIVFYLYSKSLKVHADIDYTANELLSEVIGLNIDEKIVASYQNFDSSKPKQKKDDNLIVVTNRKIFFAVYNGTNWMTLNKLLSEVEKIGIARNDVNSYLKLIFADNTSLGLRLDLHEKITTTPQLFVKQFLNTLDASLLGYDVVSNNSRRRVSISNENIAETNKSGKQSRNIELNPTLVSELKASEEIKSGRILEI